MKRTIKKVILFLTVTGILTSASNALAANEISPEYHVRCAYWANGMNEPKMAAHHFAQSNKMTQSSAKLASRIAAQMLQTQLFLSDEDSSIAAAKLYGQHCPISEAANQRSWRQEAELEGQSMDGLRVDSVSEVELPSHRAARKS